LLIFNGIGLGYLAIEISQPVADIISSAISIIFLVLFIIRTPNTEESRKNDKIMVKNVKNP